MTRVIDQPAAPWLDPRVALGRWGSRAALVDGVRTVTYGDLSARVEAAAARLPGPRRLVQVAIANQVDSVVAYLGALAAGHAVLLVPDADRIAEVTASYDPDVVITADGTVLRDRGGPAQPLHPDLALLLSTSGSTGSPKLVRLSYDNVAANAAQIADYLQIRESDCAATTLPLHYCYGLSVLHSHLARGASVLLTELSVVDECLWAAFRAAGATTFSGVPHTFELLDRVGFEELDLPRLRYVTQAGGRMEPAQVRRWAQAGQRHGWDLFVMYGQTEATARMAYLPPDKALDRPTAIGVPVPGGAFEIEDGELVYTGPNVMLGYAHTRADLALGRTVERLRTGDLARRGEDGLYEIVGRRSRFLKLLGHRVDLDSLERRLRDDGHDARCSGRDGLLVLAVAGGDQRPQPSGQGAVPEALAAAARVTGLPPLLVQAVQVREHPVGPSGKPDYRRITALGEQQRRCHTAASSVRAEGATGAATATVRELYATLLHRDDVTGESTFVALGGDSLSFVEVSTRLEDLLGTLPASWHLTRVDDLDALRVARGPVAVDGAGWSRWREWTRLRTIESAVWLRALAMVLIVGNHVVFWSLLGMANALVVLAGYQLVRFQLSEPDRRARVRRLARAVGRVAVPSILVIGAAHWISDLYQPRNVLLLNWALGDDVVDATWRFWFVEALVFALVVTLALCAMPWFHRLEARHPFGLPVALTLLALVIRLPVVPLPVPRRPISALVVLVLFMLGWAIGRATTRRQKVVVTVMSVAIVGTYTGTLSRDLLSLAAVMVVVWKPVTKVPAVVVPLVTVLAASSLYLYVVHWQVLERTWEQRGVAFALSFVAGVGFWWLWTRVLPVLLVPARRAVSGGWAAASRRRTAPLPGLREQAPDRVLDVA